MCIRSASRSPPGQVLGYAVLCGVVFRRFTALEFCSIFNTLVRPWSVFWSQLCYFNIIWELFWLHFLHQETDWSAKAATRGAKAENADISSPVWRPSGTHIYDRFKTCTAVFNVFSRRCSSHACLVSEDFCILCAFHVICARSDWTAQAWPKHMF